MYLKIKIEYEANGKTRPLYQGARLFNNQLLQTASSDRSL